MVLGYVYEMNSLPIEPICLILSWLDTTDIIHIIDVAIPQREDELRKLKWEHAASRRLTDSELAWFANHLLRVQLFVECITTQHNIWRGISVSWRRNGQLHRDDDQPSVVINGIGVNAKKWYQNDKLHRDGDLPAVVAIWAISTTKDEKWYQHDKLHRDGDQPAVINYDGSREWWQHGKRHREHGLPAYIAEDSNEWWLNDCRYIPPAK